MGALAAAGSVRRTLADSEGEAVSEKQPNLLFVQHANAASLEKGRLTLSDVSNSTLYFSDRPERITGHVVTSAFVDHWAEGGVQSFANEPPNAVLSILGGEESAEVVVVLSSPKLDGDVLTYSVEVLDGPKSAKGAEAALFIDSYAGPVEGAHYAGRHRRARHRRTAAVRRR